MFDFKPKAEFSFRILLSAAILFNALASTPTPAKADSDSFTKDASQIKSGQLKSRSIPIFPTFERPEERVIEQDEHQTQTPVLMSTPAQGEYLPTYSVAGTDDGLLHARRGVLSTAAFPARAGSAHRGPGGLFRFAECWFGRSFKQCRV